MEFDSLPDLSPEHSYAHKIAAKELAKYESEAKSALSPPTIRSLEWLDDTIRKLEAEKKRRMN